MPMREFTMDPEWAIGGEGATDEEIVRRRVKNVRAPMGSIIGRVVEFSASRYRAEPWVNGAFKNIGEFASPFEAARAIATKD